MVSLCVPDCSVQAILRGTILAGSQVSLGHTCGCRVLFIVFFSLGNGPILLTNISLSLSLGKWTDIAKYSLSLSLSLALPDL